MRRWVGTSLAVDQSMPVCKWALAALTVALGFSTGAWAAGSSDRRPIASLKAPVHETNGTVHPWASTPGSRRVVYHAPVSGRLHAQPTIIEHYARAEVLTPLFHALFGKHHDAIVKLKDGAAYKSFGLLNHTEAPRPLGDVDLDVYCPGGVPALASALVAAAGRLGIDPMVRASKHHPLQRNGSDPTESVKHLQVLFPHGESCIQLDMSVYPSVELMEQVGAWINWHRVKLTLDPDKDFHEQIGSLMRVDSVEAAERLPNLEHPEHVRAVLDRRLVLTPDGMPQDRHGEAPMLLLYLLGKPEYHHITLADGERQLRAAGILGNGQTEMLRKFFGPQPGDWDGDPADRPPDLLRNRRLGYLFSMFRSSGTDAPRDVRRGIEGMKAWGLLDLFPGMREVAHNDAAWDHTRRAVQHMYDEAYDRWLGMEQKTVCAVADCSDWRGRVFGAFLSGLQSADALERALIHIQGGLPNTADPKRYGNYVSVQDIVKGFHVAQAL